MSRAVIDLCARLHISVLAEGVETLEEAVALRELGVRLMQGYLCARPAAEQLPKVSPSTFEAIQTRHAAKILERDSSANGAADLTGERRIARHMSVIHT